MLQLLQVGRGNSTSLYKSLKNVLACKSSEPCSMQYQRIMGVMERERGLLVLNRKTWHKCEEDLMDKRIYRVEDFQSPLHDLMPSQKKNNNNKYFSAKTGCCLLLLSVFYLTTFWFSFGSLGFTQAATCCSCVHTRGRVILIPLLIYDVMTRSQCYGIWRMGR